MLFRTALPKKGFNYPKIQEKTCDQFRNLRNRFRHTALFERVLILKQQFWKKNAQVDAQRKQHEMEMRWGELELELETCE